MNCFYNRVQSDVTKKKLFFFFFFTFQRFGYHPGYHIGVAWWKASTVHLVGIVSWRPEIYKRLGTDPVTLSIKHSAIVVVTSWLSRDRWYQQNHRYISAIDSIMIELTLTHLAEYGARELVTNFICAGALESQVRRQNTKMEYHACSCLRKWNQI